MPFDAVTATLLTTASLMLFAVLRQARTRQWLRRRGRPRRMDTVVAWPPESARVLNDAERDALELAARAAPQAMVLAQVPLWRFVRVSPRHSYARWLARVGHLTADLLICDRDAQVLAVIDVHAEPMSERSLRRHGRLRRVLKAAGIPVLVWQQGKLPSLVKARAQLEGHGVPTVPKVVAEPGHDGATGPDDARPEDAPARSRRPAREPIPSDFYGLHTQPSTIL